MPPPEHATPDIQKLLGNQAELDAIGEAILNGGPRAVRYREKRRGGKTMVFVAHHDDVDRVLREEKTFSLCHYDPLYAAVSPPGSFIIMRPESSGRTERMAILKAAAARTPWFTQPDGAERRALAHECVQDVLLALRRRGPPFDLIGEYGFFIPYLVAKRAIGLSRPRTFSLLPLFICLLNRHPLSLLLAPETGANLTDLAWSEVVVAQLTGNFENRDVLIRFLAGCGASQLRTQVEWQADTFPKATGDKTLLDALWAVRPDFATVPSDVYRQHVMAIIVELASTLLLVPGLGFTAIVQRWGVGAGFTQSLGRIREIDPIAFVQEELRLSPPSAKLLRNATAPTDLGGVRVDKGEYVCALVKTAGLDIQNEPHDVREGRGEGTYLHFGPEGGPHRCFGHLLAPAVLAEMFLGLSTLHELTPRGQLVQRLSTVPGRLMADFGEPIGSAP
jgi:cytochrome P450